MEPMHYYHQDAVKFKQDNENLIGSILEPEITPLLKLIILQMTPTEFGERWADQREAFEDEDPSKVITDEEFKKQMDDFDNLDLTKREGCFYHVIGVFRSANGEPRFQPLHTLLSRNT